MRQTNDNKYLEIAIDPSNSKLLNNIYTYITKELNLEYIKDYNNTTRDILNKVKYYKLYLLKVAKDIEEHKKNIDCYVITKYSDTYNEVSAGKNTGLIENSVEKRHIEYLQMVEEQNKRVLERDLLLKSYEDHVKEIRSFINLLPQEHYSYILQLNILDGISLDKLSKECYITYEAVKNYKNRALKGLSRILECYIKNNKERTN